ncbi:hypothetical protein G4B88_023415, partial [Cannabis sativa]
MNNSSKFSHKVRHFSYMQDCAKANDPKEFEELFKAKCLRTILWQQEWSFIEGGVFPRLKNLQFKWCERLKVSLLADHFPSLTELEIVDCEELIPLLLPRAQLMEAPMITYEIYVINGNNHILNSGPTKTPYRYYKLVFGSVSHMKAHTLEFNNLEKFEEWSFMEGGVFPHLKNLKFFDCNRLKVTLLGDYFPSLTELVIHNSE